MKILRFVVIGLTVLGWAGPAWGQLSLWWVEQKVALRYDVDEIRVDELARLLQEGEEPVLVLDVRAEEEYAVGRIQGAVRVAPDLSADAFRKRFGDRLRGRHLVFYCSVGERSSGLAERVKDSALEAGALSVKNLRGGLFRWYNEGYPVVDDQGETQTIHPYGPDWEPLVEKRTP